MRPLPIRTLLLAAGALLVVVGAAVLFQPHAFFAANGTLLATDPSLMSEVRSPGGLLLASGLVVLLGAFRESLSELGLALSALVYGAYGASRLVSLALDGVPSGSLGGPPRVIAALPGRPGRTVPSLTRLTLRP